jgi:4-hydroxy-tetrahydrodipicolinate reductase
MYTPSMTEIHHTQKLDAPSGTAITLAKDIIASNLHYDKYSENVAGPGEIAIESIRKGDATGTHTITWNSEIDQITITHEARSRVGFAIGAVMAATWVLGRKGIFSMNEMLNLQD